MEDRVEERVFRAVAEKAPEISEGIVHRRRYSDTRNRSEDLQLEADVWSNEILKKEITSIEGVGQFVSEEEEEIVECGEGYGVTVDPLDGSSNIPTNNLVGTIVGIYDRKLPCSGRHIVSAFYVLYGPITTIIRAQDGNVEEFVVKEGEGGVELHRSHENIELPEPTVYGFGGNLGWFQEFHEMERAVREQLKLRYGGSLVGDSNQILHQGGIFGYPEVKGSERGKIRLLFEANPMAYVFKCAGGRSSDGEMSVLDKEPEHIHQRTPLFIGNREIVDDIETKMRRS